MTELFKEHLTKVLPLAFYQYFWIGKPCGLVEGPLLLVSGYATVVGSNKSGIIS